MNIKAYYEKHKNGTLMDTEWEVLAQTLLNGKFDQEKKTEWEQKLKERGIYRVPAKSFWLQSGNTRKYLAAASLLLIVFAAGWYFLLRNPLTSAQVMASHYIEQGFQLDQGQTRGDQSTEINRGKAYVAFELKEYEKSLTYLRIIESEGQPKAADFFQMGLCLMYQKEPNYTSALNAFKAGQQLDPNAYSDEINWFSALCYLMTGDEKAAAASLQKVMDSPSSRNRDAATALLRKIK